MKKIIFLFWIGTLISCNNGSELREVEFLFAPSFSHPTKFTIDLKNKTILQYTFQNYFYKEERSGSDVVAHIQKDTLIVHYKKIFNIEQNDFDDFLEKVKSTKLDSTIEHYEPILDGISYQIRKISSEKDTISLTSNISHRNKKNEIEYEFLDAFFKLFHKTIDESEGNYLMEDIQRYFSYDEIIKELKLKIEQVSKNPIEYQIWGQLNGCKNENNELLIFLKELPEKTPVIFNLQKGSFSYCLKEIVSEYQEKKNIYFYGGDQIRSLEDHIISIKEELEKYTKGRSDEEKAVDLLLDNNPESLNKILTELVLEKQIKNENKTFLTRDEVIKNIASTVYK